MAGVLARFVDLRPKEGRPAANAFATLFGIVAGHTMLETARDALFLTKLPPRLLTLVYVLVALGTLVVTSLNARFVKRFGQRNALLFTLVFTAYGTTVLHFVPMGKVALFVLYTWSALLGTVLAAQCWMLIGLSFTVAQGKRLFGAIASGGVLGAVVGAGAAAGLLAMVPVASLLLISSGIFVATALFLTTQPSEPVSVQDDAAQRGSRPSTIPPSASRNSPPGPPPGESAWATIFGSAYLRRMALLTTLSTATLLSVDYLFKSTAAHTVPASELGSFFARWYAIWNGASLAVQLLLTSRILRQLGVVPALTLLPLLLATGTGGMLISGGLLGLAIATKGSDGALRYSLHRVGSELLWMPLQAEVRNAARGLLDSVGSKAVQAIMAALLLALASLGLGSPRVLAGLTAVLAIGWLGTTISLRSRYLDLFRQALSKGTLDAAAMADELDAASIEAVLDALSSRDAQRVIAGIELLAEKKRARLVPGLVLYHESEAVLLRALRFAVEADRREWSPLVARLLAHALPDVRTAAVRALGTFGERDLVRTALEDGNPAVRAHAAIALATTETAEAPHEDPTIRELFALDGDRGRLAVEALLEAIADHPDPRFADLLLEMERDARPEIVERAVRAMRRIKDARFIAPLVARLDRHATRQVARDALVAQGEEALEALAQALADPETPFRVRAHLPRTISRFGSQRAADLLADVLPREPSGFIRYKALRGLGRLAVDGRRVDRNRVEVELKKNLVEHLRLVALADPLERSVGVELGGAASESLSLVLALLRDKQRQSLERSFRLLSILNPREDIRGAYVAMLSGDAKLRAQALEFLDALTTGRRPTPTGREIRELLRLATDELSARERTARARDFLPKTPASHEETVLLLIREADATLATFAAYHAIDVRSPPLLGAVATMTLARPELNVTLPIDLMADERVRASARGGNRGDG